MIKKIAMGVAAVVVAFLGYVATRPDSYKVTRSATFGAPPDAAYAIANDFTRWAEWSPWDKLDPSMKKTFGDIKQGVGATYSWVGNDKVGEGKMSIVESKPNELVGMKLEFIKPFESTANVNLAITPAANNGSTVTWTMEGNNNFMGKMASVFMNMDAMIGKDFETGLSSLKGVAEAHAQKQAEAAAAQAQAPAVPPADAPVADPAIAK